MTEKLLWKFTAYNSETYFGWGAEEAARAFADVLNRGLEIDMYFCSTIDKLPDHVFADVIINLDDELA